MSTNDFLTRAAARAGFVREAYAERKIPADAALVTATPFFGDGASEFVLASLLHRRVKEQLLRDRYWVVATHPGRAALYPFADEVWGLKSPEVAGPVLAGAVGCDPGGAMVRHVHQELNKFFAHVYEPSEFLRLYDRGITRYFFEKFKAVEVDLPAVSSPRVEFSRVIAEKPGLKVYVVPGRRIAVLDPQGRQGQADAGPGFWTDLGEALLANSVTPVFQFGPGCHDLSGHFAARAAYCTDQTVGGQMAAMRATGCVLSMFQDAAFVAALARTPFVWYEDRRRYAALKFAELDALAVPAVPRQMGFSFPAAVTAGNHWEVARAAANRLAEFLPAIDRDRLPATAACRLTPDYGSVRARRPLSLGARLFRVPKIAG